MGFYKNITTSTTTTLVDLSNRKGELSKIIIANQSANDATVSVYIDDNTNQYYYIKNLVIPTACSFVLEDNVAFDSLVYKLKITNSGGSPSLSIIAK